MKTKNLYGYTPSQNQTRPTHRQAPAAAHPYATARRSPNRSKGCWGCPVTLLILLLPVAALAVVYFLFPGRTNVLVMGIDFAPRDSAVGRSDTLILATFKPHQPYAGLVSIPRDLWVQIPGAGENRINTAHFFAEANTVGSGPQATMETIRQNFGVDINYFVRIRFEGFRDVVNRLGGVDIFLEEPTAGYPAGSHHLTGNKALAFVRHRQGADDFIRMKNGQILLRSIFKQMLNPLKLWRVPGALGILARVTDTNVPFWMIPRLAGTVLRLGPEGIDSRIIDREMVTPTTTSQGAAVLLPNWELINPMLFEVFGQ